MTPFCTACEKPEHLHGEGAQLVGHGPVLARTVTEPHDAHHLVGALRLKRSGGGGAEVLFRELGHVPRLRDARAALLVGEVLGACDDGHLRLLPSLLARRKHAAVACHHQRVRRLLGRGPARPLQRKRAEGLLAVLSGALHHQAHEVGRDGHGVVQRPPLRGRLEGVVDAEVQDAFLHGLRHLAFLGQFQLSIARVEALVASFAMVVVAREPQLAGHGEDVTRAVACLYRHRSAAAGGRAWAFRPPAAARRWLPPASPRPSPAASPRPATPARRGSSGRAVRVGAPALGAVASRSGARAGCRHWAPG